MKRNPLLLSVLLGSLGALTGCPSSSTYRRQHAAPSASSLINKIAQHNRSVTSLRGKVTADHMDGSQRIKGDVNILLARPASLHFRATDPSGGVVSKLATDGKQFWLLDVRENRFFTGDATPCNLARMSPVALNPSEIIDLLSGGAPLGAGTSKPTVAWDAALGAEKLTIGTATGQTHYWLSARGANPSWDLLAVESRDLAGKILFRATHHDFHAVLGIRLPKATKIVQPSAKSDVILRWSDVTPNPEPPIPDEAWHLESELPAEIVTCDAN